MGGWCEGDGCGGGWVVWCVRGMAVDGEWDV